MLHLHRQQMMLHPQPFTTMPQTSSAPLAVAGGLGQSATGMAMDSGASLVGLGALETAPGVLVCMWGTFFASTPVHVLPLLVAILAYSF